MANLTGFSRCIVIVLGSSIDGVNFLRVFKVENRYLPKSMHFFSSEQKVDHKKDFGEPSILGRNCEAFTNVKPITVRYPIAEKRSTKLNINRIQRSNKYCNTLNSKL